MLVTGVFTVYRRRNQLLKSKLFSFGCCFFMVKNKTSKYYDSYDFIRKKISEERVWHTTEIEVKIPKILFIIGIISRRQLKLKIGKWTI